LNYFTKNINLLIGLTDIKQRILSEQTGISQSRISRLVNGAAPDYDEVVAISKFFEAPTSKLTDEELSLEFKDRKSWQEWVEQNKTRENVAQRHLIAVSTAPIKIRAIQDHYVKTISELTGKPQSELHQEIETIFQKLLREYQQMTQANQPDSNP